MRKIRQVIGTDRFSLEEFFAHAGFQAGTSISGGQRRDVVDALATVAWFRHLRGRSQDTSPYAIGRSVEPDAYWKTEERVRFHRNKWPKYERGKHRPDAALTNLAEQVYPGSARELNSALWRFLKKIPESSKALGELEQLLETEVRLQIARWQPRIQASKNGSIGRLATAFERIGTVDALTAMLILCQSARLEGRTAQAHEWTLYIYRCMLMLGSFWMSRGIARPLFELIEQRFLKEVSHLGCRYSFPAVLYGQAIGKLESVLWHIKDAPYHLMSERQRNRYTQRILDGNFGWDLKFAFNPYETLLSSDSASEATAESCLRKMRIFVWAWNMLHSYRAHPNMPPSSVFDGTDLTARRTD